MKRKAISDAIKPRKKTFKKTSKKNSKKTDSIKSTIVKVPSVISGFPDAMMTKLKYVDYVNYSATGTLDSHTYCGNSVYDPDVTGVGHQPMAMDEYSTIYKKYKVFGASIKITFANVVDTVPAVCGFVIHTAASIPSADFVDIMERPRAFTKLITGKEGQGHAVSIEQYVGSKEVFGKSQIDDDDYGALVTANPTNKWYIHTFAQANNKASGINIQCNLTITYYVKFYDRKQLTGS